MNSITRRRTSSRKTYLPRSQSPPKTIPFKLPFITRVHNHLHTTSDTSAITGIAAIARRLVALIVLSIASIWLRWSLGIGPSLEYIAGVILENHLLLSVGRWAFMGLRLNWSSGAEVSSASIIRKIRILLSLLLLIICSLLWFVATVGDYTYQVSTGGGLPAIDDIQVGLSDPWLYVSEQVNSDPCAFVVAVLWVSAGPVLLTVVEFAIYRYQYTKTINIQHPSPGHIFSHSIPTLLCCFLLLVYLYGSLGAYAPVSNLVWCSASVTFFPPSITGVADSVKHASAKDSNYGWWNSSLLNQHYPNHHHYVPLEINQTRIQTTDDTNYSKQGHDQPIDAQRHHPRRRPNVILIVHESLSGSAIDSTQGRRAAPFWHGRMRSDPNVYQFRNVLAASGMTSIATSGILTGLIAYDEDGLDIVKSSSITKDFKEAGYDTACFSSYGTDFDKTYWAILNKLYNDDFDVVSGPKQMGEPVVNMGGSDDRKTVAHFNNWVEHGRNQMRKKQTNATDIPEDPPFFAVLAFNNNHYPFLQHTSYDGKYNASTDTNIKVNRYFSSLRTTDESIEAIFNVLGGIGNPRDRGNNNSSRGTNDNLLANTIMMGAGDHGETPGTMKRLGKLDAPILQVPMYMHIPEKFLSMRNATNAPESVSAPYKNISIPAAPSNIYLSSNLNRTTSTLDLIPTLRDVMGFPLEYTAEQRNACLIGRSLLSSVVPVDRVVQAWQGPPLLVNSNIAVFATSTKMLFNTGKQWNVALRRFSDKDPFFQLFGVVKVSNLGKMEKERWSVLLGTWFNHPFVTGQVNKLRETFNLTGISNNDWVQLRFMDIDVRERTALESVGYTENLWDNAIEPTKLLQRDWDDFTVEEIRIMVAMHYNRFMWENDRPVDAWAEEYWDEINQKIRDILMSLGFTKESWNQEIFPANLRLRNWDSFNCEQQSLQVSMGYNRTRWEAIKPHCDFDQIKMNL